MAKSARLEIWRSVVQIPVQVKLFLLKIQVIISWRISEQEMNQFIIQLVYFQNE